MGKFKSVFKPRPQQAGAYPGFCSMKRQGIFLFPPPPSLDQRVTPSIIGCQYPFIHLGGEKVKCLAQEHNTMSLTRAQTLTARSRLEYTNHEATTPPTFAGTCSILGQL